jgi:hypothetical protein
MKKNDLEELFEKSSIENYENGKCVSKQYTKEELKEKIKYYEEKEPPKGMPKWRWLYEVKRQFKLRKGADKYPDMVIATLEYILK